MSVKVGETPILRGTPPVERTLEVFVDQDWLRSSSLEKCVSFRESNSQSGKLVIVFSRSISAEEAKAFAALLLDAVKILEVTENSSEPSINDE